MDRTKPGFVEIHVVVEPKINEEKYDVAMDRDGGAMKEVKFKEEDDVGTNKLNDFLRLSTYESLLRSSSC